MGENMSNRNGEKWNDGFDKDLSKKYLSKKLKTKMSGCKCTMAQSLVGDGCDICNHELSREHEELNKFDSWFEENGYSDEHRDMFETVWIAAISSLR